MTTTRLGDVLLRMGVVTAAQLEQAMALQARHKVRLGQILVDHGFASEDRVVDALAEVSGLSRMVLATVEVDPTASRWITKEWAEQNMTLPLSVDRALRTLVVAISDPTHVAPLDELAFRTGLKLTPLLASDRELLMLHRHVFQGAALTRGKKAAAKPGAVLVEDPRALDAPEIMYGMDAVRDHLHQGAETPLYGVSVEQAPATQAAAVEPRIQALLEVQQEAARELQLLFELCVARGLIDRGEYLERLRREG